MKKLYFTEEEQKEAKRQRAKKYYRNNKEKVRKQYLSWKRRNKDKLKVYREERRNSLEGYIDRFLERAKIHTPDTDLDREFFSDKMEECPISGWKFTFKNDYDTYHNPLAPSIDRINSNKGYYKDNVQVILACLNRMKNDMPNDEFLKLYKALTWGALVDE